MRVAHLGDLGQAALRDAQLAALGQVDLLLVPVGDGPTIGAAHAMAIVEQVRAKVVVPAHYRTERIDFLEPVDGFAERFATVHRADATAVDLAALPGGEGPVLVLPAVP
jgi:L-ascorbate metabolism protein UlaG (beta-lactamase superfamily)